MSRSRSPEGRLDDLPAEQLEIVSHTVERALVARAEELRFLDRLPDPRWAIKEVAALGQLAEMLRLGQIVPDPVARDVMRRIAADLVEMDEELFARYEEAVAEHEAVRGVVGRLSQSDEGEA